MKIVFIKSYGTKDDDSGEVYSTGQVAELENNLARRLIGMGVAKDCGVEAITTSRPADDVPIGETPLTPAEILALADKALAEIATASDSEALEGVRLRYLSKKGTITQLSKQIGKLSAAARPAYGEAVNAAKRKVEHLLDERKEILHRAQRRAENAIDVTLPGIRLGVGRRHPLMQTMEEVKTVLQGMGFRYDDYPELETEFFNFDGLNQPIWHPARGMQDSFYTMTGNIPRTHTSAFQVHAMRVMQKPPIRAMTSGRCYRRDPPDATHSPVFNQLDAIAVDRGITFADLKWTLDRMLRTVLGQDIQLRFRPSYFPFTTPSAEVDVFYNGKWMELLGSGMIRPEVLRHGGLDPNEYQGFAFGMGIDRITMKRHQVDNIRLLYDNEEAFLAQF